MSIELTETYVDQIFTNPLDGMSKEKLMEYGREFATKCGSQEDAETFARAAVLASERDGKKVLERDELSSEEQKYLVREDSKWGKYRLPPMLWFLAVVNAFSAVVQGMDETVINGAQIFFLETLGIEGDELITGLVIGAPYLCCAVLGCWLNGPINGWIGRRGAIFLASLITVLSCIGQACVRTWPEMLACRFLLGLGIGISSSTVPVYSGETAPASVRGALMMQWQVFTALGIMLGNVMSLAFFKIPDTVVASGLNWRLMMGSPAVPALIVLLLVYRCPESPSWLMCTHFGSKLAPEMGLPAAYQAMLRLRHTKVQAARDCIIAYEQQKVEIDAENQKSFWKMVTEMFTVRRNRRAFLATQVVMITQQLCGVNVIAYFSTPILVKANTSRQIALVVSFALGLTNFLFAIPAVLYIDRFGRRALLLATLPFLCLFLVITGGSFWMPQGTGQVAATLTGLFLFMIAYSPGVGPVPFTYCGEAWPLYIRSLGMSVNTATTWGFNFGLAMSFPSLVAALGNEGSFFLYAGSCAMMCVLVFLFVPETKGVPLEMLDEVFDGKAREFVADQCAKCRIFMRLGQKSRKESECTFCEHCRISTNAPDGHKWKDEVTVAAREREGSGSSSASHARPVLDGSDVEEGGLPNAPPRAAIARGRCMQGH